MQRSRKVFLAKFITILSMVPAVVIANIDGAPPRSTGAPGEQTCAQSGCHVGTPNPPNGNVTIAYSGGTSYTPGERGRFTVTISDSGTDRRAFGFQAVAKLASGSQAGELTPDAGTTVICQDDRRPPCRADAALQYITHTAPRSAGTFTFEWIPPAEAAGSITVYVAGNAANGNQQNSGDRIYTSSITLTPAAAGGGGERPAISTGGVADAFTFQEGIAPNTWIALFGTNLSSETRTWDGTPELGEARLPTNVGGVSVTIDGKAAPVYAVSPGQVNVLAPMGIGTGNVQVVLKNASGETTATARVVDLLPGFYAPFAQNGRLFVTGVHNSDGTILGKPGVEPRAGRAFRPGDVVQFYANGLGATSPAVGDNQFIATPRLLVNSPSIRINDVPVEVLGSALVASGQYQVNARIPDLPNGDHPIVLEIGGARSSGNVSITVQR